MNGPGEYYAKWNNPVRERQIPYDFMHMRNWPNKENGDRLIVGEQDDSWCGWREVKGWGNWAKRKKHSWTTGVRGLNGNRKKYNAD